MSGLLGCLGYFVTNPPFNPLALAAFTVKCGWIGVQTVFGSIKHLNNYLSNVFLDVTKLIAGPIASFGLATKNMQRMMGETSNWSFAGILGTMVHTASFGSYKVYAGQTQEVMRTSYIVASTSPLHAQFLEF